MKTELSKIAKDLEQGTITENEAEILLLGLLGVSNRTWIVTIECGEDTVDLKITAPNKFTAKITASSSYSGKRHEILRCVEYGC